jgi:hypothetical protein
VFAQTIVEAPKYGASSRAAAISTPRLAAPTTKTSAGSSARSGAGLRVPPGRAQLFLEPVSVPGCDRPLHPRRIDLDAAILRQVE